MYTYETRFRLTNPVNDIEAARDYLTEDDMAKYLRDDIKYNVNKCEDYGLYPSDIISIEWDLETEQSGKIVLKTKNEMSPQALEYISDWVSGQNSDGLGEGFEQQDFAEIYDEDEWGDPDPDSYDMASFDWETNYYRFKLVNKTNESTALKESVEKCCETCKFYDYDFSTGTSICNCPDEFGSKWIKQHEPDVWTIDYDYCDKWVEAMNESRLTEDKKLENSVVVCHFTFDEELNNFVLDQTKKWLESFPIEEWTQYLRGVNKSEIKKTVLKVTDSAGFEIKVYTKVDLLEKGNEHYVNSIVTAVEKFVFKAIEPTYQEQPFGLEVRRRTLYARPNLTKVANESVTKTPTELNPLQVDAPRGTYFVWLVGDTIYGSAKKPNPSSNIVNARDITDFSAQGFDTLQEVIDYVMKYF